MTNGSAAPHKKQTTNRQRVEVPLRQLLCVYRSKTVFVTTPTNLVVMWKLPLLYSSEKVLSVEEEI